MARPRKAQAEFITSPPFDLEASVDGAAIKEIAREATFEKAERKYDLVTKLQEHFESGITHMNYMIREFQGLSPEPSDWSVSYYFPIARNEKGDVEPTWIDAPKTKRQLALCEKKAKIMAELGRRYQVYREEAAIKLDGFVERDGDFEVVAM